MNSRQSHSIRLAHLHIHWETCGDLHLHGFSYTWEYEGPVPLHEIVDRSSWELDGDICDATICSQTNWINPVARFVDDRTWTSELGSELQAWPRWAVMQGFDFQAKNDGILCGLFEEPGLIRSILRREEGARELKVLDRHIADTGMRGTVPKRILLANGSFPEAVWQEAWRNLLDLSATQAREAFGLREVKAEPYLQQDFWGAHTFNDYRKDLLPAAAALGLRHIHIGNVNRSAQSEGTQGNQCCSHAYEPAPALGGTAELKRLVDDAKALGLRLHSWTSTAQGFDSPLFKQHRNDTPWFVRMEDGKSTFGGPHMTDFHCLNLAYEPARTLWTGALLKIKADTGLDAWFLDMFTNISFLPLHFAGGKVQTLWRQALASVAELQRAGIEFDGGSTTFLRPLSGGHPAYRLPENAFINYKLYMDPPDPKRLWTPAELRACQENTSVPILPLFINNVRIDQLWTPAHRRELNDSL